MHERERDAKGLGAVALDKGVGPLPDYLRSSVEVFGLTTPSNTLSLGRYFLKKARLIEAHLSTNFPRLSIANLPLKSKKKLMFMLFYFSIKILWKTLWIVNRGPTPAYFDPF